MQLIEEDYIVIEEVEYSEVIQYEVSETTKGRRFGVAAANPPISRAKNY